jgi:phenylalanyl-tRNA synthetase beta chain
MHPGRTAEVWVNGEPAGLVGELHPAVARTFDLAGRIAVAELELDRLIGPLDLWQFQAPSLYPPAIFDLAFDVEDSVPAATLVGTTAAAAGLDLEEVGVFDEYRGAALGVGRKSLAVRYQLRAADRTLSTEEVSEVRAAIIAAAAAWGWRLRG